LDLDGKSAEEICKQLDLSIHAVYTYRARFKKQLVKQIRALQSQYESL
jgi:DNA-binding CsgD family transcriptional regulator